MLCFFCRNGMFRHMDLVTFVCLRSLLFGNTIYGFGAIAQVNLFALWVTFRITVSDGSDTHKAIQLHLDTSFTLHYSREVKKMLFLASPEHKVMMGTNKVYTPYILTDGWPYRISSHAFGAKEKYSRIIWESLEPPSTKTNYTFLLQFEETLWKLKLIRRENVGGADILCSPYKELHEVVIFHK